MPSSTTLWYDQHAAAAAARFEALQSADLLGWAADLLPADVPKLGPEQRRTIPS